jgi:hypothetical protein
MIYEGEIRRVLLDAQKTQHLFKDMTNHAGKVEPLLEFFNAVVIAHDLHADIMANEPATISVPDGFDRQRESIDSLRDRSLWDSTFGEAAKTASVEAYALLYADRDRRGRATLTLLDNEEWFPVGDPGEGGQPRVFERRWIIERKSADGRSTKRYLRIERHRERDEDGAYIVEQEAFAAESCDVLQCTAKLKAVPIVQAIPEGVEVPAELTVVALPEMPIVQLVNHRYRGKPRLRVGEHNIAIIDQCAASLSQLARAMAMHGSPKFRVSEKQVDEKTGTITLTADGFVDPDKAIEAIRVEFQFDAMLSFLMTVTKQMLISLEMSPALMGLKMGDGSNPDTVDKLRLESTLTLSAGKRAVPYMRPAIERAWTMACLIESLSTPGGGWPVAPVQVKLHPGIPVDDEEKINAQGRMLLQGLTSEEEAIRQIHGEDNAERILGEIRARREAVVRDQQASIFGAVGQSPAGTPFEDPSTGDQPTVDGGEVAA